MTERSSILPSDQFSIRFRELTDNPGAIRSSSTVNLIDPYGNTESWIIDTFRVDKHDEVFIQRINASREPLRELLPKEVTAALQRQHERAVTIVRRRAASQGMATKRAKGVVLGNPAALRKARAKRAKPPAVRQTVCRHCNQDIEGFAPYRKGEWRDRGNNWHCPTAEGEPERLHAPIKGDGR